MSKGSVYERQVDRILTGGWNLLPAGDLISPSDALQVENWRVNTAGYLRSRLGHGGAISSPGPVQSFCTVQGATIRRYAFTQFGGLFRNGDGLEGGFGYRAGMVSYQGYLWCMSRLKQKKDLGAGLLAWTPAAPAGAPTLTPTAGGIPDPDGKTYTYWVTYTSLSGQESPSGDGASITVLDPNSITTIVSPANPSDPERTHWNVYRAGDTLEGALRLNTKPIAIGANFIDNYDPADGLGDFQVTQLGIALDPNASGPPAGQGLAGPYYERLLAWGVQYDASHPERGGPNRLFWSGTLQPYNFPGSQLEEGNHVDLGELGEGIVGVTTRPRMAVIYKDNSIWRMIGDPGDLNSDVERVTAAVGAIGPHAIISVGSMDYFQGREGLYSFNGEKATKITGKLDCLFRGEFPDDAGFAFPSLIPLNTDPLLRQKACMAYRSGRLYFFYVGPEETLPSRSMILPSRGITCELGADNWSSDSRRVAAILDEGQAAETPGSGLLLGSIGDDIVSLEEGNTDAGAGVFVAYHSGYKDQGAPDNLKTYADVVIEHNTQNAQLLVGAFYNGGTGPTPAKLMAPQEALGFIQSTSKTITTFQLAQSSDKLGISARNIAIRVDGGDKGGGPATIYSIKVHYFVEPRDSETYDSDETDLGTEKVKLVDEVELDIDYPSAAGGTITLQVIADRPGPGFTFTATVAKTNGREIVRIPTGRAAPDGIANPLVEGRLLRVALRSDVQGSTFRLYGVRLRVCPYGEYIDNLRGESFVSLPVNIGMG